MTCSELDQLLFPYLDGEFDPSDRIELEAHLAQCSACAARVHAEKAMHDAITSAAQAAPVRAPDSLRLRVQLGLDQERRGSHTRRWIQVSAAAAAIAAITSTAYLSWRPMARQRFIEDAASRHAKRFPLEVQQLTPSQVEAWFGGKLEHRVAVPRLSNTELAGARLWNVKEKQAAYISYDARTASGTRPGRIGLFVYNDKQREADFGPISEPEVGASNGYNVVSWREGDVVYQLVSDLDESDIRHMLGNDGRDSRAASAVETPAPRPELKIQPASLRQ